VARKPENQVCGDSMISRPPLFVSRRASFQVPSREGTEDGVASDESVRRKAEHPLGHAEFGVSRTRGFDPFVAPAIEIPEVRSIGHEVERSVGRHSGWKIDSFGPPAIRTGFSMLPSLRNVPPTARPASQGMSGWFQHNQESLLPSGLMRGDA